MIITLSIIYFFILLSIIEEDTPCISEYGDASGGTEKEVGQTENFNLCLALVRQQEPLANGVTYAPSTKKCYAEFNALSINADRCKTCKTYVFKGKMMGLLNNVFIIRTIAYIYILHIT